MKKVYCVFETNWGHKTMVDVFLSEDDANVAIKDYKETFSHTYKPIYHVEIWETKGKTHAA